MSIAALHPPFFRDARSRRTLQGRGLSLLLVALFLWMSPLIFGSSAGQRGLLALSIFAFGLAALVHAPGLASLILLTYVALLGGLRRWLIPALGWTGMDPLLLVVAALVALHFTGLFTQKRLPLDTRLSRLIGGLLAVMFLQMVNPLQGGLTIGVVGALFTIVPLLWFYLGREYATPTVLLAAFRLTVLLAVAAALYGICQTWFGFSEGEQAWIKMAGYRALRIEEATRPFSFLTSSAEFGHILGLGAVLLWVAWLSGNRLALLPMPILLAAMVLQSSRGIFLINIAACVVVWAVQGRSYASWLPRGLLAVGIAVMGLVWSLTHVQNADLDPRAQSLVSHQAQGILNPLDPEHSTVDIHSRMFSFGLAAGLKNPLGHGLGSTTLAGSRFGSGMHSSEVEPVNILISLGLPGVFLYFILCGVLLATALRTWHQSRSPIALGVIGVLFATANNWLNGGEYFVSALVWFSIGALDKAALGAGRWALGSRSRFATGQIAAQPHRPPRAQSPEPRAGGEADP